MPGNTFSDYVATTESAVLYKDFTKTNNEVDFYWVDGGNKDVQCTATVVGQTLTAKTTFNVVRPEISFILTPKWGDVRVLKTSCKPSYYQLTTGPNCNDTNDVGMYYDFHVEDLKGYTGLFTVQMVQLINYDFKENDTNNYDHSISAKSVHTGYVLDTDYPYYECGYANGQPIADTFNTDSPNEKLIKPTMAEQRSDHFSDYLMFIPEGGKPVPLKLAAWNWSGSAYYIAGNPDGYALCGQPTIPQAATGADCYEHPQWTNNWQTIMRDSTYWTFQTNWFNLCQ